MSGFEAVGLVLGALPLAISAMEHYRDTKKAAGTFLGIKRAYRRDFANVQFCQTMFTLHIEELLQPLASIEINGDIKKCAELLDDPGGPLWKNIEVEKALSRRLRNCYGPYSETMEELKSLMIQLARVVRVDDSQFQSLLSDKQRALLSTPLVRKANRIITSTTFQGRRLRYSLSSDSRQQLLKEVETYIRRLAELLAAVDRLYNFETAPQNLSLRHSPVARAMLDYWRHAECIYRLLWRSLTCNCKKLHVAKLWLTQQADLKVNLEFLLLFNSEQKRSCPWSEREMQVRHDPNYASKSQRKPCQAPKAAVRHLDQGTAQSGPSANILPNSRTIPSRACSPNLLAQHDLIAAGICQELAKSSTTRVCLGTLVEKAEDAHYLVYCEQSPGTLSFGVVSAAELLGRPKGVAPPFYRSHRFRIALLIASSYVRYHLTPWIQGPWCLNSIRFHQRPQHEGGINYDAPYLVSSFEEDPAMCAGKRDASSSLWALGIVLLELCFDQMLEDHQIFADPAFPRNPQDPFQRQMAAREWAKDVELEADTDYAAAVKWCLQQPPTPASNEAWRNSMVQNVIQPLQKCYEIVSGKRK